MKKISDEKSRQELKLKITRIRNSIDSIDSVLIVGLVFIVYRTLKKSSVRTRSKITKRTNKRKRQAEEQEKNEMASKRPRTESGFARKE